MTVRGAWVSAWVLRVAARPFVVVDDHPYAARWGRPTTVSVEAGAHSLGVGIRYRGFTALLGVDTRAVSVPEHQLLRFVAKNGILNSEPFYIRVVSGEREP